jgi:hypothetical protein
MISLATFSYMWHGFEGNKWTYKQITDWDYRWEFSGRGSINFEVNLGEFKRRDDGRYEVGFRHIKYGNGTLLLDSNLNNIGEVLKPEPFSSALELEGDFPGLAVRTSGDLGKSCQPIKKPFRYMLKWETLPANRDRPWPQTLARTIKIVSLQIINRIT